MVTQMAVVLECQVGLNKHDKEHDFSVPLILQSMPSGLGSITT